MWRVTLTDEEVQETLGTCGVFYTAGSNFLKELRADPTFRLSSPLSKVILLQLRHQLEALDAAVVLTKAGRPQFVRSIGRSMYETYINTLGIRWFRGIVGQVAYSPSYNARRFLKFAECVTRKYDKSVERLSSAFVRLGMSQAEADKKRSYLLRRSARARLLPYPCLNANSNSWFHANGVTGLHERLWPKDSSPCFPQELFDFGAGRNDWEEWHGLLWRRGSDQIHANIVGLTSKPEDARGLWPELAPTVDYVNLGLAAAVAQASLFAGADAIGRLPAFNHLASLTLRSPWAHEHYLV